MTEVCNASSDTTLTVLRIMDGVEVQNAARRTRFSRELIESADHEYLTTDGKSICIHAVEGLYVYAITGYDDDLHYYDAALVAAPA